MVPVPEELAHDTKRFVMGLDMRSQAYEADASFDAATAERMISALNPRCRQALSLLGGAAAAGGFLTVRDLATRAEWTEHDAAGVVTELSELAWAALGPVITVIPNGSPDVDAGTVDWNERVVVVGKGLALAVVAADDRLGEGA